MGIELWSSVAGSNNASSPNGAPENMAASGVNDTIRQNMASIRSWYEAAQWADFGHTPTRIDGDTFTVATDLTAVYDVGRRVKMTGSATAYGTIASSSYLSPNTTVNLTAVVIPVTLTTVSVGILSGVNNALAESAATHSSLTVSGNATVGGTLGVTGVATFSVGSASAPALAFASDTNTGLYLAAADIPAIATGGVRRVQFGSFGIRMDVDGSAASPAFQFDADPDTGMYRASENELGLTTGGAVRVLLDLNGLRGPDGAVATPGYSFIADPDTGIYRLGVNEIAITTGGVQRARFASDIINLQATAVQVNGVSIRDASILNAGTLADARVASSNVTQHMDDGYARNISSPAKAGTTKTLSTSAPSGGSDGDIWFRY